MLEKQAEKKARQKAKEQERKAAVNEKKKKVEESSKAALVGSPLDAQGDGGLVMYVALLLKK